MNRFATLPLLGLLMLGACRSGEVLDQPTRPPTTTPPPATPPPGRPPTGRNEPIVRVGIVLDSAQVRIGATSSFAIRTMDGRQLGRGDAGSTWIFSASNGAISGTSGDQAVGADAGPIRIVPDANGRIIINGKNYRGDAVIRAGSNGRLSAINLLEIEEYLLGVVPYEIGRLAPELVEAVKAQAIAARTYAVGNMGGREGQGFDFYATVLDQVYGGVSGEDSVASRAVLETRGEIVTHAGRPIMAYYSSTCAGRTSTIQESWPWRAPQPYLQSVSDQIPGTDRAYCDTSNRYRWTVTWTRDLLRQTLARTLSARLRRTVTVNRIESMELTGKGESGRALGMRLRIDGNTHDIPGDSIRWILQPDPSRGLNGTMLFEFDTDEEGGQVTHLEVKGGGWGHGIGMCQVGAIGRARAGHSYRDILKAYYTDTEIERAY